MTHKAGVGVRRLFICRDCGDHGIGLVRSICSRGVDGIESITLPSGWEFNVILDVTRVLCRGCITSVREDALCGAGG